MMTLPRNAQIWFPGYVRSRWQRSNFDKNHSGRRFRVWLALCDHYEPLWGGADEQKARERVAQWARLWPQIAMRHCDAAGKPPKYTFFYPQEEYRPGLIDPLAKMTQDGIADVEVHIHHDREGERDFVDRMNGFTDVLHWRHSLLRKHQGKLAFGFIHGNWALDNSLPGGRFCGLNNEVTLLRDMGCYADFTMPSCPSPSQSGLVNTIYWAVDDPARPKSYNTGTPVRPGRLGSGDLLMIPGPLAIRWKERLIPRIERGELAGYDLATPYRIRRWLACAPRIGDDLFIKLFTHGCQERNSSPLLSNGLDDLFRYLAIECASRGYELHFASAWEMYQAVRAAAGPVKPTAEGVLHVVTPGANPTR